MQDYNENYARVYDIITKHKNYSFEVEQIEKLLKQLGINNLDALKALSIGCGTGSHEALLVQKNPSLQLDAIDVSPSMISCANEKRSTINSNNLNFECCDIGRVEKHDHYDISFSLFNVVNCLSDTSELQTFFLNANRNIVADGYLIFEAWNASQCIAEPPVKVEREYSNETEGYILRRTATPHLDGNKLTIKYSINGTLDYEKFEHESVHKINLFTRSEIKTAIENAGFVIVDKMSALPDLSKSDFENARMHAYVLRKHK